MSESGTKKDVLDVLIVSMPWVNLIFPSIQLGVLKTLFDQAGIKAEVMSAYLDHCDWLTRAKAIKDWHEYIKCGENFLIFEWAFSGLLTGDSRCAEDAFRGAEKGIETRFTSGKRSKSLPSKMAKLLDRVRAVSKPFLEYLADEILAKNPRIVGFSLTLQQNTAALSLSKILKARRPDLQIILGGSNCEGVEGEALLAHFPWVDVVFHGEAESALEGVVRKMLARESLVGSKGVSFRDTEGRVTLNGADRNGSAVSDWVIPNFDEYFERLTRAGFKDDLRMSVVIPFENSRGCWWGQKHQCRFCALNSDLVFRTKPPEQALSDLLVLANRYRNQGLHCVDNILHPKNYRGFLEALASGEYDLHLFFEVKSNIGLEDLFRLKRAGVESIQPGIENLSTEILTLMNKGVTGIQNIRLLKFCSWLGIEVAWNMLYGFPGESPSEYERMADQVKSLCHLTPPTVNPIMIQRSSYYFDHPEQSGLRLLGPHSCYRVMYGLGDEALHQLGDVFMYDYLDGRKPDRYVKNLRASVKAWRALWPRSQGSLVYYRTNGSMTIVDKRPNLAPAIHQLGALEGHIYALCFDIISLDRLAKDEKLAEVGLDMDDLGAFLDTLVERRLMIREGNQFLALALPTRSALGYGRVCGI